MKKYVYPDVPRTGLCNMLFPWARAMVWARDNKAKVLAPQWVKLNRIGPWIRGEKDKRYYWGQFSNEGYVRGVRRWLLMHFSKSIEVVSGMGNYFDDIANEAKFLKAELLRIVSKRILAAVEELPCEFIGVHIRRGDFSTLGLSLGESYYLKAIKRARALAGALPILVFSDAKSEELDYLKSFEDVRIMSSAPAVQDLLSLSRSTVMVATNRSTFSGWAAFLGRMPSIWSKEGERPGSWLDHWEVV